MESKIVSLVLAEALVTLPKITAQELYEKCTGKIGDTTLPNFRIQLSKWLNDKSDPGYIPGYESRLGRAGGIYKIGTPNVSMNGEAAEKVTLDPAPVIAAINKALETAPRIRTADLFIAVNYPGVSEAQFRAQLGVWFAEGVLADFETHKGPTGGIYRKDSKVEQWIPVGSDDDEQSNNFSVQVTPSLKIVAGNRNWKVQRLNGEIWGNIAYHPDIAGCIGSIVKKSINDEFGNVDSLVQLKDVASLIKQVEGRIFSHLEKHLPASA